jgi:FAD/FMN-containing dehydrogenase
LPDRHVERYVGEVIPQLQPDDVGMTGFLLLFPMRRSKLTRPLFKVPSGDQDWVWLFDILTAAPAPGPNPEFLTRMLARNRELFERARRIGGKRYPIGALEFSRRDWIEHYGAVWDDVVRAKKRFDPDRILTPGPGIF